MSKQIFGYATATTKCTKRVHTRCLKKKLKTL